MRALIPLLTLVVLLTGCTLQPDLSQQAPQAALGQPAPPISGQTLAGTAVSITLRSRPTVLVFWASWCGPCRQEQPSLDRIAAQFGGLGVQVIGIDMLDHDLASARAFVQEFKVPYPSLYDDSGAITARYQVDYPPSVVLVNARGSIVARYPGEISELRLRNLIETKLL